MTDDTAPNAGAAGGEAAGSATPGQPAAGSQQTTTRQATNPNGQAASASSSGDSSTAAAKQGDPNNANAQQAFKIPDAWKEKPWASKIKSEEDLYKQIDTLDALKGKKTVVPDFTKATPKEVEDYYAQTRPENTEAYQFAEGTEEPIKKVLSDALFKNGVTAHQANAVIKQYQDAEKAQLAEQYSADGMNKALETSFGEGWKEVGGQTARILKENLSADDAAMMDKLPNVFLGLVYRMANNLVKGYGIEETGAHTGAGAGKLSPNDVNGVREGLRKQITELPTKPHTAADKQALIDKLNKTYEGKK